MDPSDDLYITDLDNKVCDVNDGLCGQIGVLHFSPGCHWHTICEDHFNDYFKLKGTEGLKWHTKPEPSTDQS